MNDYTFPMSNWFIPFLGNGARYSVMFAHLKHGGNRHGQTDISMHNR